MTREEIDKFLANTKVYVNGKSKEIQKKLFSLGYKWFTGSTEVHSIEDPFLFIYGNMTFSRDNDMVYFSRYENREISAEEILSLKPIEPDYRPFKTQEECWNEMLKHQPFGYVKSKYDGSYNHYNNHYKLISKVLNSTTVGKAADCVIEFQNDALCYHDMVNLYNNYTFADGTPFGVKEE